MVHAEGATYAVEMGPVWNVADSDRGVLCEGAVGSVRLGRFRAFRYELRCWAGGRIPDVAEAVDSPVRTTEEPARVRRVLEVLELVPPRSGHDMDAIRPPPGGRAPGWDAGLELARRQA